MAARTVVATATVPAPHEAVWELLCDTARYAEWVEATDEVIRTDGPAAVGSTYDERNTVLGPVKSGSRWTVLEHEPPRRTFHRGEGILLTKDVTLELAARPAGAEATEVTVTFRYVPALGPLGQLIAAAGMHRVLEAGFRRSLRRFAEIAASERGATAAAS